MFFIYFNWKAKKNIAVIHKYSCGDCQSGNGKREVKTPGLNGVWIGPFADKQLAESFVLKMNIQSEDCSRCIEN
jgi:hypothetical protein